MEWNTHITINRLRVPPSRFVVKVYISSLLHNHTDPQGSMDFLSGFTLLALSSPEPSIHKAVSLTVADGTVCCHAVEDIINIRCLSDASSLCPKMTVGVVPKHI
uniref:Uncharacterized protein n=1 Tax=Arion vulgaris TaxID=1028688 RepID=A0A0B7AK16_9EUPU